MKKFTKKNFLPENLLNLESFKFFQILLKRKFDMITNCKVETLDETKKINSIFLVLNIKFIR